MFGGVTGPVRTHAPQSKVLWLGIVGCLAACLVASPVSAAPGWSRPADVSRPEKVAVDTLSVIASSQGSATAVWQLYGGKNDIVESAGRQAGGSWSAPYKLFGDVRDIYISPQIAVDPVGNMTAVWDRREGRTFVVQSATRPAGGSWSVPVNLSKPGATSALVAVDPEGEATVVWLLEREGGNRSVVQSATRPAGGSWSAPVSLSPGEQDASSPQIALDPQGGATAVWEEESSGAIQSATRPAGGSWSASVTLSATRSSGPQVAVDAQGNATAVWERYNPKGTLIQSATRPAGGSWSASVDISKPGRYTQEAQIAVGPQGDATAIWARSNGRDLVVQSATRPAGGSWSAPIDISVHRGQGGFYPRLVVDSWGNATAVWKGYDSNRHNLAIQAATRPLGGGWSSPTDVSNRVTRHMGISEPQIAVDSQGISTVVWVVGVRGGGIIQAATSGRR